MLSVCTIVRDRAEHLERFVDAIARLDDPPAELVVVDMGSHVPVSAEALATRLGANGTDPIVRRLETEGLPLAGARNLAAATASGELLVFCDVDCLIGPTTIGAYRRGIRPDELACGPVRYLDRWWDRDHDGLPPHAVLVARSSPHPARPTPNEDRLGDDHELFWSLSFGCDRATWDRLGGFDESFAGYGAEDTDLGFAARELGNQLRWLAEGEVVHQWHHVDTPPRRHLASIVPNARRFRAKWGRWPMEGWLRDLAAEGLLRWEGDRLDLLVDDAPTPPRPRILSLPAAHPYIAAIMPDDVDVLDDPSDPWWPHPGYTSEWIDARATEIDVVHAHFGFDHLEPRDLARWCRSLREHDLPLVVTVHDLRSPHDPDPAAHRARLDVLTAAADHVLTLTESAAAELARRDVAAEVIPHPPLGPLEPVPAPATRAPVVGVHLKPWRANSLDHRALAAVLGQLARDAELDVRVHLDDVVEPALVAEIVAHGGQDLEVDVGSRLDDGALLAYVDGLDVVVLPYAFGTHSGWLELCRDRGVAVVAPDTGHYPSQWDRVETFEVDPVERVPDPSSLEAAIRRAARPATGVDAREVIRRRAARDDARERHRELYRRLTLGRSGGGAESNDAAVQR